MERLPKRESVKMVGPYAVGRTLGEGSFGKVKLGIHNQTGQEVALKMINYQHANARQLQNIEREKNLTKLLDHPNIVKLYDVVEIPENNTTCLVLEYVSGGELFDYIVEHRRLTEKEAAKFFNQILSALEYTHSKLVIHRDLKPENLLLDAHKNIKIMDFGLSNSMKLGSFLSSSCGSPLYSAPEILNSEKYIGPEVDVWSIGVILFAMVCGYVPWLGRTHPEQIKMAMKGMYEVPAYVSSECKSLLSRALVVEPKLRATTAELRRHPWLLKHGYKPTEEQTRTRTPSQLDAEIIGRLEHLGYHQDEVIDDIYGMKTTSQGYSLYYLLLDQKEKIKAEEEAKRLEAQRLEAEQLEKQRLEAAQKLEEERKEQERQRKEQERLELERVESDASTIANAGSMDIDEGSNSSKKEKKGKTKEGDKEKEKRKSLKTRMKSVKIFKKHIFRQRSMQQILQELSKEQQEKQGQQQQEQ